MMKRSRTALLTSALLTIGLISSSEAQESLVAPEVVPNKERIEELVRQQADSLLPVLAELGENMKTVRSDIDNAEIYIEQMIATAENVVVLISPESDIGVEIGTLRDTTAEWRDYWRSECDKSRATRDCERVNLWEEQLTGIGESEQRRNRLHREAQREVERLRDQQRYIADDRRLGLVDAVVAGLNEALDGVETLVEQMGKVGDPAAGKRDGDA